jgi:hypothetical protein
MYSPLLFAHTYNKHPHFITAHDENETMLVLNEKPPHDVFIKSRLPILSSPYFIYLSRATKPRIRATMPPPISLDTILEGLKQGNSLELEFIKQLKEGLSFVAEGIQNECYNRSDALSDAIGKLEKVMEEVL